MESEGNISCGAQQTRKESDQVSIDDDERENVRTRIYPFVFYELIRSRTDPKLLWHSYTAQTRVLTPLDKEEVSPILNTRLLNDKSGKTLGNVPLSREHTPNKISLLVTWLNNLILSYLYVS